MEGVQTPFIDAFLEVSKESAMELKTVVLRDEEHARKIWGSNFVLLQADGHVAWRGQEGSSREVAKNILEVVTSWRVFPGYVPARSRVINIEGISTPSENFTEKELLALDKSV